MLVHYQSKIEMFVFILIRDESSTRITIMIISTLNNMYMQEGSCYICILLPYRHYNYRWGRCVECSQTLKCAQRKRLQDVFGPKSKRKIMIRDLKRTSTQINKQNRLDGGKKGQHDQKGKILYTKYINLFPRIKLESTLKRWPFDWIHKTHSHGISV